MPTQIEDLGASVSAGNCRLTERLSHRTNGAAANLGGEALRETAFGMEKKGKTGDREALSILLPGASGSCRKQCRRTPEKHFDHYYTGGRQP